MVATQLSAPQSKLRLSRAKNVELFFPEAAALTVERLYKAMDVLEKGYPAVEQKLVDRLGAVGLRSKLLSHDATTQGFRIRYDDVERAKIEQERLDRGEGEPVATVNDPPLRMRGRSKIKRSDRPQVAIEAVLGEHKLIVHHATHAGNTTDQTLTPKTLEAVKGLGYKDVTWTAGTGMNRRPAVAIKTRDALRAARFDFVMGEGMSRTNAVK